MRHSAAFELFQIYLPVKIDEKVQFVELDAVKWETAQPNENYATDCTHESKYCITCCFLSFRSVQYLF